MRLRDNRVLPFALAGVCLLLTTSCTWPSEGDCLNRSLPPPAISIRLDNSLVLGADPSLPRQYLFGDVQFVQTDRHDRIYVADRASMEVKIYDSEGGHLGTIGGRGREEGQFRDINCMWVTDDGTVMVIDGINKRITFMNWRGEVLKTRPVDTRAMLWPRRMQAIGQQYALLYKLPQSRGNDDLFHLFDGELQGESERFGSFQEFGAGNDALELSYLQVNPGRFWVASPQDILYSPALYRGKIYHLSRSGNRWETAQPFCGHVEGSQPLSELDGSPDPERGQFSFMTTKRGRQRFGIFRNESRGVFALKDGRIVHFTLIERAGNRVFGVEIYQPDGRLAGYAPLLKVPLAPGEAADIPVNVHWKDSRDRFYLVDGREIPTLRVVTLGIKDQTEHSSR